MNKQQIVRLLLEEMVAVCEEKELDENILKRIAAQIKGLTSRGKDGYTAPKGSKDKDSSKLTPTQHSKAAAPVAAKPAAQVAPTTDKKPSAPNPKQDGLKSLSRAEINQALGPIKNFGKLDIKKVRKEIANNISKQLKGNPFAKKFKNEQLPNIVKILDQIEKILEGDFENLIRESNSKKLIKIISEEIIEVINEEKPTKAVN
jgi:hypothetical protein